MRPSISRHPLFVPLLLLAAGGAFFVPLFSTAYDDNTTHPALTQEIVNLYNAFHKSEREITGPEQKWIVQGSIDEDDAPRWLHHFYDPTTGKGWAGYRNAKEWGYSSKAQRGGAAGQPVFDPRARGIWYIIDSFRGKTGGDFSWENGIEAYARGDYKHALLSLGHVLHLLEDVSVPEHTRDDFHESHADASPLEEWTKQFSIDKDKGNKKLALFIKGGMPAGIQPMQFASYHEYFHKLATYSHTYFFSNDTVNPPPQFERRGAYGYGEDESGIEFRLARFETEQGWLGKTKEVPTTKDVVVLQDYFSRLASKAISYGAGLVKLFIEEGEKKKAATAQTPSDSKCKPTINLSGVSLKIEEFEKFEISGGNVREGVRSKGFIKFTETHLSTAIINKDAFGQYQVEFILNSEGKRLISEITKKALQTDTLPLVYINNNTIGFPNGLPKLGSDAFIIRTGERNYADFEKIVGKQNINNTCPEKETVASVQPSSQSKTPPEKKILPPAPQQDTKCVLSGSQKQTEINLKANEWSCLIVTPEGSRYQIDPENKNTELTFRFFDGSTFIDKPGETPFWLGEKRGEFQLMSKVPMKVSVLIELPPYATNLTGVWSMTWRDRVFQQGSSEIEIYQKLGERKFTGKGTEQYNGQAQTFTFTIQGETTEPNVVGRNVSFTENFSGDVVTYNGTAINNSADGSWKNNLDNSGTWSMTRRVDN